MARLILQPDAVHPSIHQLTEQVEITRGCDNSLMVATQSSGKPCATIEVTDDGGCRLRDNGSSYRTTVNGSIVTEVRLMNGDTISFGGIKCRYEEDGGTKLS